MAETVGAVALDGGRDRAPGDVRKPRRVDAARQRAARRHIVRLGADAERHAGILRNPRQVGGERLLLRRRRILPGEPGAAGRRIEISLRLAIDMREGDHHLVDRALERAGEPGEGLAMPRARGSGW